MATPLMPVPAMPISSRREGFRAALTYAGLASFAAVCVVWVMLRYVAFPRRR